MLTVMVAPVTLASGLQDLAAVPRQLPFPLDGSALCCPPAGLSWNDPVPYVPRTQAEHCTLRMLPWNPYPDRV